MTKSNPKTLAIAAVLLMVLALLFMATPLLRSTTGFTGRTGTRQFTPQGFSGQVNGFQGQASGDGQTGQGVIIQGQGGDAQGQGITVQGGTTLNLPNRQFTGRGGGLLGFGLLNGTTGMIVYAVALLISLVAAVGMLMTKQWGKILGIIMGVIYTVIALFSLVPTLLITLVASRLGFRNPLSIWLNVLHLVLAIAVIILASIKARSTAATPNVQVTPPASPA